jgi:hypothetical protein
MCPDPADPLEPSLPDEAQPFDELLAAADQRARADILAERAERRQQSRRRFLPLAIAGASVLSVAAVAERFVTSTVAPQATASSTTTQAIRGTSSASAILAQVTRILRADRQAIAALAEAEAKLAQSAAPGDDALSVPQLPSLPSLPSASSLSVPAPAPAPATHATTGASVVIP